MHKQARLPEIFDQILNNTPVLEFWFHTTPSPHTPQINFSFWVQIQTYP